MSYEERKSYFQGQYFVLEMSKQKERQFGDIYDDHIDKIYRFIFLKVDSENTAQDVTAQVFTKGWKKFKSGARIDNISAYLYQIARAEIANYYRGSRKYKVISVESTAEIVDTEQDIEKAQIKKADIDAAKELLGQLNEDAQNVLVWKYLDNYSNKEIAKMLNKSEGAVRVMVHRALAQLREKAAGKWPQSLFGLEV